MHSTLDTVGLKSKVYISTVSIVHVVLVKYIIQALIEVFQVEEDHCSSSLHANLNLVDVSTDLHVQYFVKAMLCRQ